MTTQELEFESKKDKMRLKAVDKEVRRLRNINRKQSAKLTKLRKALLFQAFFFISLLLVLLVKGMINFSGNTQEDGINPLTEQYNQLLAQQRIQSATLNLYRDSLSNIKNENLVERGESGYKYRIQIGAFKEIDLTEFADNLGTINQETYDSIYQYTLGKFDEYEKALEFWSNIKNMGFADSFIVATKDGRRVPLHHLPAENKDEK
ncbi:hypothetical protein SAMN06265379_103458 [Saccharicrinis carchari]|uniref:SPOR domain-containing protein n=1 Tax=Saccharicrinis carchari TaxID=1168039 RepID=A0A521CVG0_SACCC|nr:hypothetical protein [Saccharicrinis carchari]SMO62650.1 hypothetical protein SAMN06265379_103458 [Saccharicrinis carchari]